MATESVELELDGMTVEFFTSLMIVKPKSAEASEVEFVERVVLLCGNASVTILK